MTVPVREPDEIRQQAARKLRSVTISDHFQPILGFLLNEDHSYFIVRLPVQPDGPQVAAAVTGQVTGQVFDAASGLCESREKRGTPIARRHEISRDIPAPQHPRRFPHLPPKGSSS